MESILTVNKRNIINYSLYIIFVGIFLGFPNIIAERMKNAGILFYHIVSTNTIIAVLAYLYIVRGVRLRQFSELCNRYIFAFLFMLVPILISAINAYDIKLGLLYLRNYLFFCFLCILILWRLKTKEDILSLLMVFSLAGTVFAVFTILFSNIFEVTSYLSSYQSGKLVVYRLTVFGINSNTLGYIFAVLFIIKVSLLRKNNKLNVFLIAACILDIYCLLMTFSRGGFAVLIAEVIVYIMLRFRFAKFLTYILVIVFIAYFITDRCFHSYLERVGTLDNILLKLKGDSGDLSSALLNDRLDDLNKSFGVGIKHFFGGVGGYNLNRFVKRGTHNQFLNMFVENGIVTFAIYFIFVVSVMVTLMIISLNVKNKSECGWGRNISFCLTSIMCGSFLQGMVSYLRYDFWVICGMAIAWIMIVKNHAIAKRDLLAIGSREKNSALENE